MIAARSGVLGATLIIATRIVGFNGFHSIFNGFHSSINSFSIDLDGFCNGSMDVCPFLWVTDASNELHPIGFCHGKNRDQRGPRLNPILAWRALMGKPMGYRFDGFLHGSFWVRWFTFDLWNFCSPVGLGNFSYRFPGSCCFMWAKYPCCHDLTELQ